LSLLAAAWVWRRRAWGVVLGSLVLVKATTMGLALLSMTVFSARSGEPLEAGLLVPWLALAGSGAGMTVWLLTRGTRRGQQPAGCHGEAARGAARQA
ncbi:MAG: hypothetical protein ACK4N5_24290, partial [Myxococcales bacterium]